MSKTGRWSGIYRQAGHENEHWLNKMCQRILTAQQQPLLIDAIRGNIWCWLWLDLFPNIHGFFPRFAHTQWNITSYIHFVSVAIRTSQSYLWNSINRQFGYFCRFFFYCLLRVSVLCCVNSSSCCWNSEQWKLAPASVQQHTEYSSNFLIGYINRNRMCSRTTWMSCLVRPRKQSGCIGFIAALVVARN